MSPYHLTVGNIGYSPREEIRMHRSTIDEDRIIAEREGADVVDDEAELFATLDSEGLPGDSF